MGMTSPAPPATYLARRSLPDPQGLLHAPLPVQSCQPAHRHCPALSAAWCTVPSECVSTMPYELTSIPERFRWRTKSEESSGAQHPSAAQATLTVTIRTNRDRHKSKATSNRQLPVLWNPLSSRAAMKWGDRSFRRHGSQRLTRYASKCKR